jgi:hypothetical protein
VNVANVLNLRSQYRKEIGRLKCISATILLSMVGTEHLQTIQQSVVVLVEDIGEPKRNMLWNYYS